VARIYRGMHHPTDVVGSFINGGVCLIIMARGILDESVQWTRSKVGLSPAARSTASSRQPA
jgi:undecaprenyl-diphosphatase